MIVQLVNRVLTRLQHYAWNVRLRLEPIDERGGGRNTDEGFHISAGAVIAGVIAAGVAAFVADKLGALK
ncbi:hypothetical protein [Pseudonocardia sp. KRD291]|uniref:hypothetical protein n=1 Tax=Pseudonocardia sp. KRD291 TaxID=2792007 RepID=UPI001C4A328D|nr:hypothetical protein [Pseudonocardia sp. KRD291]MBW0101409.1 hypothetical protein [Pseudonocardia sp. KRD291]